MKIFANKNLWRKIVIAFIVITLFTFTCPKPVNAAFGGTLLNPICDFLTAVGDFFVHILHTIVMDQDMSLIHVNIGNSILEFLKSWGRPIALIGIAIAAGVAVAMSHGMLAPAIAGVINGALAGKTATLIGMGVAKGVAFLAVGGGLWAGFAVYNWDFWRSKDIYLPMYSLSPETIFKGQIDLFNVNFFDEDKRK